MGKTPTSSDHHGRLRPDTSPAPATPSVWPIPRMLDRLLADHASHHPVGASGLDVGLPDGQMGNSEVGHTNIGAGRVVYQDLTRISQVPSRTARSLPTKPAMQGAMDELPAKRATPLHLCGLLSDGGVHSHILSICTPCWSWPSRKGLDRVYIHCLSGRP